MPTPSQRLRVLAATVPPWWLLGGLVNANAIGIYKPIGAASLAASYVNLANPGTNDAAPGTAPTWAAATGWTFAGASSQYLTTGIVPTNDQTWSMIIRVASMTTDGSFRYPIGKSDSVTNRFAIGMNTTQIQYGNGGALTISASVTAGVFAVAGATAYRNGVAESGACGAASGTATLPLYIGARNLGAPDGPITGNVLAVAIYNTTLTAAQVLAVSNAMGSL